MLALTRLVSTRRSVCVSKGEAEAAHVCHPLANVGVLASLTFGVFEPDDIVEHFQTRHIFTITAGQPGWFVGTPSANPAQISNGRRSGGCSITGAGRMELAAAAASADVGIRFRMRYSLAAL
jgi:hypothetical protein